MGHQAVPLGHHLNSTVVLPLDNLKSIIKYFTDINNISDRYVDIFLEAILHKYFMDAEGRRISSIYEKLPVLKRLEDRVMMDIHRSFENSTGPLMPSIIYRYEIQGNLLYIVPTLPTLQDYDERIRTMADPDEGWVPARYRR